MHTDETTWMAAVVEVIAVGCAIAFALLRSA
jgi:hypothetical protein